MGLEETIPSRLCEQPASYNKATCLSKTNNFEMFFAEKYIDKKIKLIVK